MAGRRFLVVLAVLTGCCFISANLQAGLVDSNTDYGPLLAWDGFGAEFSPEWEGVTTVVDTWQELENSGTSGWISDSGCTISAKNWTYGGSADFDFNPGHWEESGGHWETHPTVRKISSSSDSEVLSTTWLRFAGREFTATKNDDSGAEMARYATLVSPQEKLLANASAIAYGNTSFGNDEFSADGRVSTTAILTIDAEEATAGSTGRSWFEATYELDRDTDFSLDLDLAIRGQIDFSFTVTDVDSEEVAFHFDTISNAISVGTRQKVSMDGALEAGTYEFAVNCMTDAAVNSLYQWNPGGQAKFDLSLDLEEEYVQVWVPDYVWVSNFPALQIDDPAVSEPSTLSEPVPCFLAANWQSGSAASVPEPSTLTMLVLGGLGCLVAGRQRRKHR